MDGAFTIWLPLHSMTAFIGGTILAENYDLFPSFFMFSCTWLLLATNENSRRHPSPWRKPRDVFSMYSTFITGRIQPAEVAQYQFMEEIEAFDSQEEAQLLADKFVKNKENDVEAMYYEQLAKEEEDLKKDSRMSIGSKKGNSFSLLAPLKPILLPIQLSLGKVIIFLRVAKSMINWEASYYAFLGVNLTLVAGLVLLPIPWGFLLEWTFRLFVWIFLGPWMKLVDIFWFRKRLENANKEKHQSKVKSKSEAILSAKRETQMYNEFQMKMRDMKCYLFGKFIVEVPRFKEYRYRDIPDASSFARPVASTAEVPKDQIVATKRGQFLDGDMIPVWGKLPKGQSKKTRTSLRNRIKNKGARREMAPQADSKSASGGRKAQFKRTLTKPLAKRGNLKQPPLRRAYSDGENAPLLSPPPTSSGGAPRRQETPSYPPRSPRGAGASYRTMQGHVEA